LCFGRILRAVDLRRVGETNIPNMKKNLLLAVPVSLIAVAALVLSVRSSVSAESLIGYASVFALLGVAALEYRITWKRLFGRS
jgi:hypothetical protein